MQRSSVKHDDCMGEENLSSVFRKEFCRCFDERLRRVVANIAGYQGRAAFLSDFVKHLVIFVRE
jgi:hypothetical protein